jgi:hypothetical protein
VLRVGVQELRLAADDEDRRRLGLEKAFRDARDVGLRDLSTFAWYFAQ